MIPQIWRLLERLLVPAEGGVSRPEALARDLILAHAARPLLHPRDPVRDAAALGVPPAVDGDELAGLERSLELLLLLPPALIALVPPLPLTLPISG